MKIENFSSFSFINFCWVFRFFVLFSNFFAKFSVHFFSPLVCRFLSLALKFILYCADLLARLSLRCRYNFHLIIDWGRSVWRMTCAKKYRNEQSYAEERDSRFFLYSISFVRFHAHTWISSNQTSQLEIITKSAPCVSLINGNFRTSQIMDLNSPCIFRCNNWHVRLIGELQRWRSRPSCRSNILLRICRYASHLKWYTRNVGKCD